MYVKVLQDVELDCDHFSCFDRLLLMHSFSEFVKGHIIHNTIASLL